METTLPAAPSLAEPQVMPAVSHEKQSFDHFQNPDVTPPGYLGVSQVFPDPDQVRKEFDLASLEDLTNSIRERGVIQPIIVRRDRVGAFIIVAGERRWRAAKAARLHIIPAIIRNDLTADDIEVLQLIENVQRENLTLAEECRAVGKLVQRVGHAEAVRRLRKSPAWVSMRSSVTEYSEPVKALVMDGKIKDVQIAHTLNKLAEIEPSAAERYIGAITGAPDCIGIAATRANIEASYSHAKQHRDQQEAARQQAEADAAKPQEKAARLKKSQDEAAERERQREAARVEAAAKQKHADELSAITEPAAESMRADLLKSFQDAGITRSETLIEVMPVRFNGLSANIPKRASEVPTELRILLPLIDLQGIVEDIIQSQSRARSSGIIAGIEQWISETLLLDPNGEVPNDEAFSHYERFASDNDYEVGHAQVFIAVMKDAGHVHHRKAAGRVFRGIALKGAK